MIEGRTYRRSFVAAPAATEPSPEQQRSVGMDAQRALECANQRDVSKSRGSIDTGEHANVAAVAATAAEIRRTDHHTQSVAGLLRSFEAAHHADMERPWKLGETPRPVCIGVADGATRRCANVE